MAATLSKSALLARLGLTRLRVTGLTSQARALAVGAIGVAAVVSVSACGTTGPGSQAQLPPPAPEAEPFVFEPLEPDLPPPPPDTTVRAALLVPLGARNPEVKRVAQSLADAAQLALFRAGNPDLELQVKDTEGTPDGARRATAEALSDGAEIILGPLFSENVRMAGNLARSQNVPVIGFSSDSRAAGPGVFLLSFQPEQEVDRIVAYALTQGINSFAAMIPQSPYGDRVRQAFIARVYNLGAEIAAVESYGEGLESTQAAAERIAIAYGDARLDGSEGAVKANGDAADTPDTAVPGTGVRDTDIARPNENQETSPFRASPNALGRFEDPFPGLDNENKGRFGAVLIPEGGRRLQELAHLLPFFDLEPGEARFVGTGLWNSPELWREPSLRGGWFAAPPPDGRSRFNLIFEETFGYRPPSIASIGYDALALVAALADGEKGQRFTQLRLTDPEGFSGVDGIFRFRPDGVTERGLAVLEVSGRGEAVVVGPAPDSFDDYVSTGDVPVN